MIEIRLIIEHLMSKKGWKQYQLAEKARISKATMSEIISGKTNPDMTTIQKIATAFGMNLSELLDYKIGNELPDTEKTIDSILNDTRLQLLEWALKAENMPYLEFAYNVSKNVPANLLSKLKFMIDFNTGGGSLNE